MQIRKQKSTLKQINTLHLSMSSFQYKTFFTNTRVEHKYTIQSYYKLDEFTQGGGRGSLQRVADNAM